MFLITSLISKHSKRKFIKMCPNVRCDCCNQHYYSWETGHGRCKLKDKCGLSQSFGRFIKID